MAIDVTDSLPLSRKKRLPFFSQREREKKRERGSEIIRTCKRKIHSDEIFSQLLNPNNRAIQRTGVREIKKFRRFVLASINNIQIIILVSSIYHDSTNYRYW